MTLNRMLDEMFDPEESREARAEAKERNRLIAWIYKQPGGKVAWESCNGNDPASRLEQLSLLAHAQKCAPKPSEAGDNG